MNETEQRILEKLKEADELLYKLAKLYDSETSDWDRAMNMLQSIIIARETARERLKEGDQTK
jgi:hypothetical protein